MATFRLVLARLTPRKIVEIALDSLADLGDLRWSSPIVHARTISEWERVGRDLRFAIVAFRDQSDADLPDPDLDEPTSDTPRLESLVEA
ncbi:MAG TPA: hypothetical protein VG538_05830 [Vicinamibacterales bacterium]|jgi:hypothetical protein|nr:hypothetical protein [Vicinamibacterales bacterium]